MPPARKTAKKTAIKKQTATKSSAQTSERPRRALVPQKHGGALLPGGTGGAGTGRPRDEVRASLLRIAQGKGIGFLAGLMEGQVPVSMVGQCPKCDYVGEMPEGVSLQAIVDKVHASVDQRLKGNEQALKYGLGSLKEVSTEQVRDRIAQTLTVIRQHCSTEQAETIVSAMRPIWV